MQPAQGAGQRVGAQERASGIESGCGGGNPDADGLSAVDSGALLGAVVSIAIFLLVQTGALIWWAATITQGQKDHGYRIQQLETVSFKTSSDVAYFKGQKGMEP